ncbi:YhcH/YjgK/YiaL family protein [Candidatus Hepatincolaceae symbiont of Richtersius coronifer]
MIVDYIENSHLYGKSSIGFILNYIKNTNFLTFPKTIYDVRQFLEGDQLFYTISQLNTKPIAEGFWESHRKYIDVHYILEGEEIIGYNNITHLTPNITYNKEKDLITYAGILANPILLQPKMFAAMFQSDAHMPNLYLPSTAPGKRTVTKVVFKLQD